MTLREAESRLAAQLRRLYGDAEAAAIADLVLEHLTGLSRSLRNLDRKEPDPAAAERLEQITQALLEGRPVQYVLGEAWFGGLRLKVDERVLIPRPETEELVHWVVSRVKAFPGRASDNRPAGSSLTIIDAGTGSGCIALTLKHQLPQARVLAFDFSREALELARENAVRTGLHLEFIEADMLKPSTLPSGLLVDLIVSNPPYIPASEAGSLPSHVRGHEPHAALFVPEKDPLLFYRALAGLAWLILKPGGFLFVETHAAFGAKVAGLFRQMGFDTVELRKDMQGLPRMVSASARKNGRQMLQHNVSD